MELFKEKAEQAIEKDIREGKLDNLDGQGKPLSLKEGDVMMER